ncbi:hydrolase [Solemya pervernicosa gill symbiont]|uniref:Hydrolase n=2 Tax=Gammaproteobacteria incertae sedis TaxID=118884 RepID=A0A1T2L178_9GAMM|nr:hydrolase [Candidatus Reidiella endopervernicosa]OOZ38831.1 hydrolase [Solemya pervernicosa gill symbiont]QKQ27422.1 hydrolase [Candidatus Reidiella endopervernicosa]
MSQTLLCDSGQSLLTIIDIQPRLASAMPEASHRRVIDNSRRLLAAATLLEVPQLISEQYPKGLGHTEAELLDGLSGERQILDKSCFSCEASETIRSAVIDSGRRQLILAGMEAHICVLQTALAFTRAGLQVFVVEDAICSRVESNHANAAARMREAGVVITNTESVLFEWLRDARHEQFKAISALVK